MRRHTSSLILTAALALSLAPVLHAQGHRDDGRYSVFPDAGHLDRASAIAREIDQTASQIRREFERNNRRPNPEEARAIDRLRQLDLSASRFRAAVDSYRREPRRTSRTFAALEDAFNDTTRALRRIPARPYVDSGMDRIYRLMDELGGFYGRRTGYYGTWGHDRDHDRDHDHDRRPPLHR
jgi:hypothetical protein